jgi:myo-inositol-1(or 4)-monophosphatase
MPSVSREVQQQIMDVVREAGKLSLRWFDGPERIAVHYKGETDLVTIADREVEAFLRKRLHDIMPDAGMLGEEGTDTRAQHSGRYFVVDPIDGTSNFVHGLPFYAIALALKDDEKTIFSAVYAPALDWMYYAALGEGAWRGDKPLKVSKTDTLIKAVAATGFACIRGKSKPDNMPIFTEAVYRLQSIRRFGSAAMDLCLVAEGKLDIYWEIGIQPWDIAAGILIVREAGGRASDLKGGDNAETRKQVLATNGLLHDDFLKLLHKTHV